MDSKTKHRLLGVLVMIGLVVILFPFFQSNKDFSKEARAVTAPPFPDQSVQVSTASSDVPDTIEEQTIPLPPNTLSQANDQLVNQQPDDTINAAHPTVDHEPNIVKASTENTGEEIALKVAAIKSPEQVPPKPVSKIKVVDKNKTVKKLAQAHKKPLPQTPLDDNGLIKLKNAAWVIQLGSFNKKENALRLVNQLRANGYRAFIQQVSTRIGNSTRVFVGPEVKHDQARALAIQLESDLHIHGMVISYKPLVL